MDFSKFISQNSGLIITGIIGLVTTIIGTVIGMRIGRRKAPPKIHVVEASAIAVPLPAGKYRLHVPLELVSDDTPLHISRTKLNGIPNKANITLRSPSERTSIVLGHEYNELPSKIQIELFTPERRILKYEIKDIKIEGPPSIKKSENSSEGPYKGWLIRRLKEKWL